MADVGSLAYSVRALKQGVDSLAGYRGNPLDRAVTFDDLVNLGLASSTGGNSVGSGSASSAALAAEAAARTAGDTKLQASLTSETARAEAQENVLLHDIQAETTRAETAEAALQVKTGGGAILVESTGSRRISQMTAWPYPPAIQGGLVPVVVGGANYASAVATLITGAKGVPSGAKGEIVYVQGGDDADTNGTGAGAAFVIGGNSKSGGGGGNVSLSTGEGDSSGGAPGILLVSLASGHTGNSGQDGAGASVFTGSAAADGAGNGGDININLGSPGLSGRAGLVTITGTNAALLVGTTVVPTGATESLQVLGGALIDVINVGTAASVPTITAGSIAPTTTQVAGSLYLRNTTTLGARLYVSAGGGTWNAVSGV